MGSWIWRWGPAILIMGIIFAASATPGSDLPEFGTWDFFAKKGGHMLGYAMLAFTLCHAVDRGIKSTKFRFFAVLCLAALYAFADEFHQRFTPGRTSSLRDVGIDTIGATAGLIVWTWFRKWRSQLGGSQPAVNSD